MPRELVHAPGHDRTRSLGWLATAWIEHWCVHGPGDVQGDEVELDDEFVGFLVDAYALDADGRRLYSRAALVRPKGRSKSELAGFVGLFEARGPSRFAGWATGGEVYRWRDFVYHYAPGEPMGRPLVYPYIRCLATEETQTGNTYDVIHFNLEQGPLGDDLPRDAVGLTRVLLPEGGEIVPSTASSSSKDGGKESLAIYDEPHLYVTPELRRMFKTVDRNLRKRRRAEPWALLTSTMYQPGEDSVLEAVDRQAQAIREGRTRAARLLWDHRQAPAGVDLTDIDAVVAALAEAYGPAAAWMDLPGIVHNEFWDLTKDPEDARRYFFNQRTASATAWVTALQYASGTVPDLPPLADGEETVLFFDGSAGDDATALLAVAMDDGRPELLHLQERPPGAAGKTWRVDKAAADLAVRQAFERFDVLGFAADVREFENYIDTWALEFRDRLLIESTTGRHRHAVAWDMRGRVAEFTNAAERTRADIRAHELPLGEDLRLRRHVLNARAAPNRYGVSIAKPGRDSPHKIDAAVCLIGARMVRRWVLASEKYQRRHRNRDRRVVVLR
ncbi:Terminase [Actinokineospora cianjurensis]|uniref:Phage terminase large subunit-like protein n=1 Tax=Actinokineospora cianjurensis TaxID=585224 RepID=A0A421AY99_9PSEU|nr:Terminase [Actinokineospora cianjurensis]RLK54833.1 phage terminase large subunit-like protein [Actinokineospora cianjurensis]